MSTTVLPAQPVSQFSTGVRAWIVCLAASLFFYYEFIQMNMMGAISVQLMRDFNLSASELGFLSATYLLADVLVLLPAGIILDRFSTRTVILSAMLVCILGTVGFASTHSLYLAGFYHFLSGIGNAFCFLSCMMLATRWFPPQKRAFVIGVIVTMAMMGGVMAAKPFVLLSEHFGWRQTLFMDAGLGVVILSLIALLVTDSPEGVKTAPEKQSTALLQGFLQAVRNKQNWYCGVYTSLLNLPIMVLGALFGIEYLHQAQGVATVDAATITSMIFFGTIIGSPLAGWVSDHIGSRRLPMAIGAVASLAVIVLIMSPYQYSYYELFGLFLALGFFSSTQVVSYPMVAESNPEQITGTALGLASVLIMGGAGIAQPLFGYLMDLHWAGNVVDGVAVYSRADFQTALMMLPIGFLIALLAVIFARETGSRQ